MSKSNFFIPFLRNNKKLKLTVEALFLIPVASYVLALPALALQGKIFDALLPVEAGFCIFLSIVTYALAAYKLKKVFEK